MVRLDLPIGTVGDTLIIIVGVDDRIMPRDMRADIEFEIKRKMRATLGEEGNIDLRWMEQLTDKESEVLGQRSQYAIKAIVDKGPGETLSINEIERIQNRFLNLLGNFSIPITTWTNVII